MPNLVIRVSDSDNNLVSHVQEAAGWAIGFVRSKCSQLDMQLRNSNNGQLPQRSYYWAIVGKDVARISLKVDVLTQSWFAKIIVGGLRVGDLIMIPTDSTTGARPQILVQSEGTGGPYVTTRDPPTEPGTAFVAGNFDWKGRTRKTDFDGNPLDRPETDILTWNGPITRAGPTLGGVTPMGDDVWKDGLLYAVAPAGEFIVGSAIQARGIANLEQLGDRKHIIITDSTTTSGGPGGRGEATWKVYTRPEETIADPGRDPGIYHPDTNPGGWKLIATLTSPDDFNGTRWQRMRVWYFNRSGNQCSAMMPVNEAGDPAGPTYAGGGTKSNTFPMRSRLMSIDINAFTEIVTLNDEGVEPTLVHTVVNTINGCSDTMGSQSASSTSTWGGTIPATRRVSVDYKGDTRVFATLGVTSSGQDVRSSSVGGGGWSVSGALGVDIDFSLRIGATTVSLGSYSETETMIASGSAFSPSGSIIRNVVAQSMSGPFFPIIGGSTKLLYADLRSDLAIVSYGTLSDRTDSSVNAAGIAVNATNVVTVSYTPWDLTLNRSVLQEATINGDVVASYSDNDLPYGETNNNLLQSFAPHGGSCPITFNDSITELDISLESFQFLDADISNGGDGRKENYAATDSAGNTALSLRSFSGFIVATAFRQWIAGGVQWTNFITGDDTLLDVMNQIEHVLPGVDGNLPSDDDVTLPPVANDGTGRGVSIKVI